MQPASAVPEPSSLALMGLGALVLGRGRAAPPLIADGLSAPDLADVATAQLCDESWSNGGTQAPAGRPHPP